MDWKTATRDDGRKRYHAEGAKFRASIYDYWEYVYWYVYDVSVNTQLAKGESASADEAKQAVERAIIERGLND